MRKKTCKGVGQAFAYLIGAFQTVGTFLGLAVIGSRFMRILFADPTTLVVELELDEGEREGSELASLSAGRMKAADLLSREDLFNPRILPRWWSSLSLTREREREVSSLHCQQAG